MPVPFVGPSYSLALDRADLQRSINLYPVANEVVGGKDVAYLAPTPGLVLFSPESAPPTPGVVLFRDEFDGSSSIDSHTPDVHPVAFVYGTTSGSPSQVGSGLLVPPTPDEGGFSSSTATGSGGWSLDLGVSYSFKAEISDDGTTNGGMSVQFQGAGSRVLRFSYANIVIGITPHLIALAEWDDGTTNVQLGVVTDPAPGLHTFELRVGPAGIQFLYDGVDSPGSPSVVSPLPLTVSSMQIGFVGVVAAGNPSFGRVELATL